jgi:hypothetical protein
VLSINQRSSLQLFEFTDRRMSYMDAEGAIVCNWGFDREHNNNNDAVYVGTLRTTINF